MDLLNFTEGILEQELRRIEELRQYKALTHSQAEQLAKLQEERDAMLNQRFKAHLTPDDPDKSQGQNLQEQLA
ncbi:putative neuroblastoma breakpoint member 5 [Saguinus oedipus]|uniref:Neuroblastoma breakpoint member 5 n=1 Tax=Saguinus oedipus TaxID=9490 RepID=A0ABQ9VCQ8_SAGOE|nr:putative neuroblastoma breakpoint member 5 [Saguinus oedipus]